MTALSSAVCCWRKQSSASFVSGHHCTSVPFVYLCSFCSASAHLCRHQVSVSRCYSVSRKSSKVSVLSRTENRRSWSSYRFTSSFSTTKVPKLSTTNRLSVGLYSTTCCSHILCFHVIDSLHLNTYLSIRGCRWSCSNVTMTESETIFRPSSVQAMKQLWMLCLQLATKFVSNISSSCIVLVNNQLTQDHKRLRHLNSLTSCLTLQCILLENVA